MTRVRSRYAALLLAAAVSVGASGSSTSARAAEEATPDKALNDAKEALQTHQIAALVADTPTAQYISSAQIKGSVLVGQFPSSGEHYGLVFSQGNPLVTCVNKAIATLKSNGTLTKLQQKYLKIYVSVPALQP